MSQTLHLGCGTDIRPNAINVDVINHTGVDEVVDLNDTPWPWEDNSTEKIIANHVFEHLNDMESTLRECDRILKSTGVLKMRMPVGLDAFADPDHKHTWEWRTPEFYCGKRPWDVDVGLTVVYKDVNIWPAGQTNIFAAIDKLIWKYRKRTEGPGPWMFNQSGSSGEFQITFQKP